MIRRGKIPLANERKVNVRAQGSIAFPPRCPGESHLKTNVCEKQLLCPLLLSSLLLLFPPAPLKLSFSFLLSRRLRLTPSVAALSPASHLPAFEFLNLVCLPCEPLRAVGSFLVRQAASCLCRCPPGTRPPSPSKSSLEAVMDDGGGEDVLKAKGEGGIGV